MSELQILQELENDLSTIRMTERASRLRKVAEEFKGTENTDLVAILAGSFRYLTYTRRILLSLDRKARSVFSQ